MRHTAWYAVLHMSNTIMCFTVHHAEHLRTDMDTSFLYAVSITQDGQEYISTGRWTFTGCRQHNGIMKRITVTERTL